jgi:hypothetical protein
MADSNLQRCIFHAFRSHVPLNAGAAAGVLSEGLLRAGMATTALVQMVTKGQRGVRPTGFRPSGAEVWQASNQDLPRARLVPVPAPTRRDLGRHGMPRGATGKSVGATVASEGGKTRIPTGCHLVLT